VRGEFCLSKLRLIPKVNIVNLITTADLKQFVDLEKLRRVRGFVYNTAVYHCAYLKDDKTQSKVSIFSSGKMISVGSKSLRAAERDLNYAAGRLAELGLITPTRITVRLQNIVATGELGHSIDVESLATRLPNVIYEPEQFPGAIYYAAELEGASVLVFANGKLVFAGLKREELLRVAEKVATDLGKMV
jgi:transcription initiation factor TFIID TATA-box-binding protein